jgi:hypothetical protein
VPSLSMLIKKMKMGLNHRNYVNTATSDLHECLV